MWLSRKLSQHEMQDVASAQDGTVTVEGGELAVFSSGEKREVKTAAPGGYEWQPKKGEVRLRSVAAGTDIVLRYNGRIDSNGLLFFNGMPYLGMGG